MRTFCWDHILPLTAIHMDLKHIWPQITSKGLEVRTRKAPFCVKPPEFSVRPTMSRAAHVPASGPWRINKRYPCIQRHKVAVSRTCAAGRRRILTAVVSFPLTRVIVTEVTILVVKTARLTT